MAGENAKLRENLFNDYSGRFADVGGQADSVQCPICLTIFGRDALVGDRPKLTLAHVLPESLGGTFCSLACAGCNNDIGSDLEAFLIERFRAEDAMNGVGKLPGRLVGDFGSIGVEFQAAPPGEPWTVLVIEKQTNAADLQKLNLALGAKLDAPSTKIAAQIMPRSRNRPNRVSAALYQSAYLLMFAYFGYDVVNDLRYAKLREQILRPDEDILQAEFDMPPEAWANKELPDNHGVLIVKEPEPFIMPVFRLRPVGGRSRVIGVRLPGLDNTTWPRPRPKGRVKGVVVRFRRAKDDGSRLALREVWEQAKMMP